MGRDQMINRHRRHWLGIAVARKLSNQLRHLLLHREKYPLALGVIFFVLAGHLHATPVVPLNGKNPTSKILLDIPIEKLLEVEFVTLFKKRESLMEAPAAVYSLSNDDIVRSGATRVPDALRLIPGLQVAQHNANSWAVTARGFSGMARGISGQFANKLLVLADGRSVYTPLFSGVSWETQDFMMEDLARVEVIRGPGATLWGSNAVNGIINIVSKDASATQGTLISAGGGTEQRAFTHIRHGGKFGIRTYYRVFAKYLKQDSFIDENGLDASDDSEMARGGFRVDSYLTNAHLTVQGEIYGGEFNRGYRAVRSDSGPFPEEFTYRDKMSGGHLRTKLHRDFSSTSALDLQVYFDRVSTDEAVVSGRINTFDVDLNHRFPVGERHEVIWGTGYRLISDRFDSTFAFYLNPARRNVTLLSAFAQDAIELLPYTLTLTVGSKFEHSDLSGFVVQPSARIRWTPNTDQTLWAAVSRAVRTPSRGEHDGRIIQKSIEGLPTTTFTVFQGDEDFRSENVISTEIGYRRRLVPQAMFDMTFFYNRYTDLQAQLTTIPIELPTLPNTAFRALPVKPTNDIKGKTFGFELSADWQINQRIGLSTSYSYLQIDLENQRLIDDTFQLKSTEGLSPEHQALLAVKYNPATNLESDLRFRYVGSLPSQDVSDYITADFRIALNITNTLKLALVGQNLLQSEHFESSQTLTSDNASTVTRRVASQVQRSIFSQVTWNF